MGAIMLYGWIKLRGGQIERRELARERMWARFHLTPMLQAEKDRDDYRRLAAMQQREDKVTEGIPNFPKKDYNSNRFVFPEFLIVSKDEWKKSETINLSESS